MEHTLDQYKQEIRRLKRIAGNSLKRCDSEEDPLNLHQKLVDMRETLEEVRDSDF